MAKKKTTTRRRRRKSASSAAAPRKVRRKVMAARGKRRKPRKKAFLSEFFSPEGFKSGFKAAANGSIGGLGNSIVEKMLTGAGANGLIKFIVHGGAAVMIAGGLKYPNLGAGYAGAYIGRVTDTLMQELLSEMENNDYADSNVLSELPDGMDEDGNALFLAEDGNFYYLEDFELAEDGSYALSEGAEPYLQDSFQAASVYPQYVNTGRF